ncbi:MAG: hypothetical protein M3N43_02490, partial [Actinomycetota bacterium]|nr:hypothetical protein [Actinomycetota bacterium]
MADLVPVVGKVDCLESDDSDANRSQESQGRQGRDRGRDWNERNQHCGSYRPIQIQVMREPPLETQVAKQVEDNAAI